MNSIEWPYPPRYFETGEGRMHYVDVGPRESVQAPLVLVHGTPVSSLVFRRFIARFASERRVIAIDHLGFGRSEKPPEADYRPATLAGHLERFLDQKQLDRPILVVNDFGGPIGLSYAINYPSRVGGLILFNTWMWSLADTTAASVSRIFASPFGRFLYLQLNFSPRVLLPLLFADKSKLTADLKRAYTGAFPRPADRHGPWTFARELLNSSEWYETLWNQRRNLAALPALVLWGMQDRAFSLDALERWQQALPQARIVAFADCGHLVQEESPEEAIEEIAKFLRSTG